jgi:hypothetical protein
MTPIPPFWFKQRQCKLEPAGGDHAFKVTAPNFGEAFLSVAQGPGGWRGSLRWQADGPEADGTAEVPTPQEAWGRLFELFRTRAVI